MSERADPTNDAGLVLGDDGIVYEVASDGTRTPLNSGSQPLPRSYYISVPALSVDTDTATLLPWVDEGSGTSLLDLTVPTIPTIITAGVHAITATVRCSNGAQAGKWMAAQLEIDAAGDDLFTISQTPMDYGPSFGGAKPYVTMSMTHYIPAGGEIKVTVEHDVGVAKLFAIAEATVQRIT